jgi:MFS family permease
MLIKHLATGLSIPVLNVFLLQKGATLQTLPLLLAIFSVTVVCMELPSGIFADMYGRKKAFLLSCVMHTIAVMLMLTGNHIAWLVMAMVFYGLGRAFSSGSLDALFIDQAINRLGDNILAKATARLMILEGVGFAAGSVAGGVLASVTRTYLANLIAQIVLYILLFVLSVRMISEQPIRASTQRSSLKSHLLQGKQVVRSSRSFILVLTGVLLVGFFLGTIESYWQSTFMKLSKTDNIAWMLGLITFIGFATVIFGSTVGQKWMDKNRTRWWILYTACRILFGVAIVAFAVQGTVGGFITGYVIVYMFLGINSVVESTLINKMTPAAMRASMLSLSSLIAQIGMIAAALFSSILVGIIGAAGIWMVAGSLMGGYALFVGFFTQAAGSISKGVADDLP